jgi:hypothetical protein
MYQLACNGTSDIKGQHRQCSLSASSAMCGIQKTVLVSAVCLMLSCHRLIYALINVDINLFMYLDKG